MFECPGIRMMATLRGALRYCVNCGRAVQLRNGKPVHTGRRVAPRRWIKIARATA